MKKRKKQKFNPNRQQVSDAVADFLKNGGKIKEIEVDDKGLQDFLRMQDHSEVDDFLRGE